jgi:uncharacterized membrane protein YccC
VSRQDRPGPMWLMELVRPRPAPTPWLRMVRAPLAVCVPLIVMYAVGHVALGLPAALGGLISSVMERGGPYLGRVKRVGTATILGGAVGMGIGLLIHNAGWLAVLVVMLLSLVSAAVSAAGSIGSVTGLQLLLYASLATGPLALIGPWWLLIGLFLAGAFWSLGLSVLGWVLFPRRPEQRSVAEAYRAIARMLRAIGTEDFETARNAVTTALNTAYDEVLAARAAIAGRDPARARLVTLLNETHRVAEAAITLASEGNRPLPLIHSIEAIADSIRDDKPVTGPIPEPPIDSLGARALKDALVTVTEVPAGQSSAVALPTRTGRQWLQEYLAELRYGRLVRQYAVRLTLCMGVAAVTSEILALQRSYWVMMTVVVVLKPDFGSIFARALQRGVGTVLGAVIGAGILAVVPYGPLLLIPIAVLAFLLPYGFSRNFGLFGTLLTPLVLVLLDLLTNAGWSLAQVRLIDTLLGCAIALVLGYALWPSSWHAHVDVQFADAAAEIARYLRAFGGAASTRSALRRKAYRRLSDLHTVFQRALSEPAAVSRRATGWYPAAVALERTVDAITATVVTAKRGGPAPSEASMCQLADALDEIARAVRARDRPRPRPLPDEPVTRPITAAIDEVLSVF